MSHAAQIARGLAGTPFVPKALRAADLAATTANVAAALLTGRELGIEPMAALRSINIIEGTPALSALAMRALVLVAGHDMWVEESTATRAIVAGQRRNSGNPQSSTWTIDRARTAGLAGKQNYRTQPQAMLIARATAECARLVAPEALLGMPYSVEELGDGEGGTEVAAAPERAPSTRTARRRSIPAAPAPVTPETALVPPTEPQPAAHPPAPPAAPADDTPMITKAQLRALHAAFRDLGITDKPERMRITVEIIGRTVESANDLYEREASTVIDELRQRKQRADAREVDRETLEATRREAAEAAALEADLDAAYQADQPDLDWGDDPNPDN
jgi:hypothetical protein